MNLFGSQRKFPSINCWESITKLRVNSNLRQQTVVIKSVRHFRLQNERDVLRRFQGRTPSLRPLLDEIEEPSDPPALVLKHLDDDLSSAAETQRLTRKEIKYVARRVLEALKVLHEDGYVHTGMKFGAAIWKTPKVLMDICRRHQTRQCPCELWARRCLLRRSRTGWLWKYCSRRFRIRTG